ncbi:adenylate-forming enzyme AfeA [Bombardia bombarda]|uniref:Adenylate-forming enzyme AfeA n=1 Tax=Bombardia bombarda TaxID=252184 RepID=A0AA39XBA5_9PEZI|nr:adenylate-forming enzyme AfeA [Bombardia bombarda]
MGCSFSTPRATKPEVPITDLVSYALDKQTNYDGDKRVFINAEDPSQFLTADGTVKLVRQLIAGMQAQGLKKGDSVLLHMANHYLYGALVFAIMGAGGIACGSNPAYQVFELNHVVETAAPRFIITAERTAGLVLQVCEKRGMSADSVFVFGTTHPLRQEKTPQTYVSEVVGGASTQPLTNLLRYGESDWQKLRSKAEMKNTIACYYSTSGTTGLPKLAQLSHYALIAQREVLHNDVPYEVIRLSTLPLFHTLGAIWPLFATVRHGNPVYIMARFNLDALANNIHKYAVSETYLTPPIIHALNASDLPLEEQLATVRYIGTGGAPIDGVAIGKLKAKLNPKATISQIWGMTEFGIATIFRWGEQDTTGSIGRILPGYEMRLVDGEGKEITADNVTGELQIRTAGVMSGYKNKSADGIGEDKWFPTGDVVYKKNGKLYINGRQKELIKVRGWQVAPAEIEAVLLQHPEVADCAVIGTPTADQQTEVPRAYIVRKKRLDSDSDSDSSKGQVTGEEIYDYIRGQLASYKRLDGGVVFVTSIPRTASGKTQRFKLAEMEIKEEKSGI